MCQVDFDVIFEDFASPSGGEVLKVQLSLARCSDKALEHFINVRGPVLGGLWVFSDEELEGRQLQARRLKSKELQARNCE